MRLAGLVVALAAVIAVATAGASDRADERRDAGAVVVSGVEADLARVVSALRVPRRPIDVIPPHLARPLAKRAAFGSNAELSRLAVGQTSQSLYLVPGDGHLCIVLTHAGSSWSTTCASTEEVATGRAGPLISWLEKGAVTVTGVVPDSVSSVAIGSDGAGEIAVAVENNVYFAVLPSGQTPERVSYEGPSGRVSWPIRDPAAPGAGHG